MKERERERERKRGKHNNDHLWLNVNSAAIWLTKWEQTEIQDKSHDDITSVYSTGTVLLLLSLLLSSYQSTKVHRTDNSSHVSYKKELKKRKIKKSVVVFIMAKYCSRYYCQGSGGGEGEVGMKVKKSRRDDKIENKCQHLNRRQVALTCMHSCRIPSVRVWCHHHNNWLKSTTRGGREGGRWVRGEEIIKWKGSKEKYPQPADRWRAWCASLSDCYDMYSRRNAHGRIG